jgi:hypothetical protein
MLTPSPKLVDPTSKSGRQIADGRNPGPKTLKPAVKALMSQQTQTEIRACRFMILDWESAISCQVGWIAILPLIRIDTRKSVTGYLMVLNGGPVSWKSSRQGVVTLSSSEAEFVAASQAAASFGGGRRSPLLLVWGGRRGPPNRRSPHLLVSAARGHAPDKRLSMRTRHALHQAFCIQFGGRPSFAFNSQAGPSLSRSCV